MAPGDLQEAFRQGVLAAMRAGQRPMLTGLRYGPGPNDVTLDGADTGKAWVRWPDESREQTQVWGSANRVNATVLVGPGWDGEDKILEVISRPTAQVMQEAVRTVLQPQGFDELVPRNIPSEQLKPGRVGPSESGGTYIHVDAFDHKLGRWTGAPDLDVGSLFPVNLGEYGRIGVYLDPQSNGLVAFAGEQVYTYEDFTEGDRDLVPDGMYALGAVIVTNGGTISASNKFEDWRKFLEAKGEAGGHEILVDDVAQTQRAGLNILSSDWLKPVAADDPVNDETEFAYTLDPDGVTDIGTPASTDLIPIFDVSANAMKSVEAGNLGSAFVNPMTSTGDLITISATPVENSDRSGTSTLGSGATETVISDCDLTLIVASGGIDVGINVWWSMNQPSVPKNVTLRLRRDSVSGAILASNSQGATIDSSVGHDRQWSTTYNDTTPTTGRYVLTFQRTAGGVNVISDTRQFSLTAQSPNPARVGIGSAGQVLKSNGTVPEWDSVASYSTANVSNPPTDAELDSAFGTPATVGAGFVGVVNDNNGGTNEYLCWSDGSNWFYVTGTKAT